MPGLTEERLNNVKYKSMADYMNGVDALESLEDKMAFTVRYLLAYGPGEGRDVSFAEAIHIAKLKIADASAKLRANIIMVPDDVVDPSLKDEQDAPYRQFMIEPVAFLQDQTNQLLMKEANDGVSEASQRRIADYQLMGAVLANDFNGSLSNQVRDLEIEQTSFDVRARLNAKFGGKLEKAYKDTKPGLLSKAFGTSSTAYHNLDQAYQAFNNPDHANYGNMNALDKAAVEYLRHCLPRWNPKGGLPSKIFIDRLSGTKKARAMLSYNILKATAEQRKTEPVYDAIVTGNLQSRAEAEAGIDEVAFQQNVANDVGEDHDLDSSQAEKDYHQNFVLGEEVEDEGPELE